MDREDKKYIEQGKLGIDDSQEESLLTEAKEDKEKFLNWLIDGATQSGMNQELATSTSNYFLDLFLNFKQRIKSPYNDFYYWMKSSNQNDFIDYINKLKKEVDIKDAQKKQEQEGATLVYSDDNWKVYKITTYEASAKYGKNTKWCISGSKRWRDGQEGKQFFDDYTNRGITFYFFINKKGEKYALAVYPDDAYCEIFNAEDVKIAYIPNAPKVDEIKVVYDDNSDRNILVNAILSGKLNENIMLMLMEETTQDWSGNELTIYNRKEDLINYLKYAIPDGIIEHNAASENRITPEEYESLTGDVYDEYWGGDLISIDINDLDKITNKHFDDCNTKEEFLSPGNIHDHKYYEVYDNDHEQYLDCADDLIELYLDCNSNCGIDQWENMDIEDFYRQNNDGEETTNKSRAEIFAIAMANRLRWDIKNGKIPLSTISNLGLSQQYLLSFTKEFESLEEKIVKKGNKWQFQSKKGRNLGTYDTKPEAEKRLKQVHYFKHVNEDIQETDNEGNILSTEQINFFKDSKVRNNKGQLVVCYHSTDHDFDVFDSSFGGEHGNLFGDGFYFSTHSDNIYAYGNKYKVCYLNVVKPYSMTKDNNNETIAKELIKNYCGDFDEEFYNKVNKFDPLGVESNVLRYIQLKTNKPTTFTKVLKASNYDGVIADNLGDIESRYAEIVVFNSNQVKSINNKTPSDSNNINEDYKDDFINRTTQHIARVNKYAKKIGRSYPNHDSDKFNELFDGYSLMNKKDVSEEEQKLIDDATYKHIINNEHHCEHWCNPKDVEGFSRSNPTPHGCLDCTKMPEYALEEMCCDWCAMSEEFGNTPFEWYEKNKDTRWHFNEEQDKFILDTLHKLWDTDNINESTGFPITVYTYQKPQVRDLLEEGETYIASYERANYNHYKDLAKVLGLSNCPIFGALSKEDLYHMLDSSGIDWEDENIIHLEIPKEDLKYTEYYDWTDYMYALDDSEGFKEETGLSLEDLENLLRTQKSASEYENCQVVFDRIESKWYQDGKDEEDALKEKLWKTKTYSGTSWNGEPYSYDREEYEPSKDSKYQRLIKKPINTLTLDEIKYIYAVRWAIYMQQAKMYDNVEEILTQVDRYHDNNEFEQCYNYLHSLSFPLTIYRAIRVGNYKSSELNPETNNLIVSGKQQSYSWTTDINIYKNDKSKFKNENTIVSAKINSNVVDVANTIFNFIHYSTGHDDLGRTYGEYEITLKNNFKQSDLQDLHFIDKNLIEKLCLKESIKEIEDYGVKYTHSPYELKNYLENHLKHDDVVKIDYYPAENTYVFNDGYAFIHYGLDELAREQGIVMGNSHMRYIAYSKDIGHEESLDYSSADIYEYDEFYIAELFSERDYQPSFEVTPLYKALGKENAKYNWRNWNIIDESLKEGLVIGRGGNFYIDESPYKVKDKILNAKESLRIFVDENLPVYLTCKLYECTHSMMVHDAKTLEGVNTAIDDFDKKKVCIIVVPSIDEEYFDELEDAVYDEYDTKYSYNGFNIYSRYQDFSKTNLYKVLGSENNYDIKKL